MKRYLSFLPLLIYYIVAIALFSDTVLEGDEIRHMNYAHNLIEGEYTNPINPELINGPGYPLVLAAGVLAGVSNWTMCLINSVFLILAVIYFYKTLKLFFDPKQAQILSYILGLYPPLIRWSPFLYSEAFAVFLVCGFLYYFMKSQHQAKSRRLYILLSALFLGGVALTKVIFGYVLLFTLLIFLVTYLVTRTPKALNILFVLIGAFVVCLPYLGYTYTLTKEFPYWGSGGGEILYWRASPYPDEYGDWISSDIALSDTQNDFYNTDAIILNHKAFLQSIDTLPHIAKDAAYTEKAIEFMREYPGKYVKNTVSSSVRLFFNYPYSYTQQKLTSYFYFIPNGMLLFLLLLSTIIAILRYKEISISLYSVAIIMFLALAGLIAGNGMARYLLPVIPLMLLFIFYILSRSLRIDFVQFERRA